MATKHKYTPKDLGRYEVFTNSNSSVGARVFLGHPAIRYLGFEGGDQMHVFPCVGGRAVVVATDSYADTLTSGANPVEPIASRAITHPSGRSHARAYLTGAAMQYVDAEPGDIVRVRYGAQDRYVIAERTDLESKTDDPTS